MDPVGSGSWLKTENEALDGVYEIWMCTPSEVFFSRYDLQTLFEVVSLGVEWLHLSDSAVYKKIRDRVFSYYI
jgi:hypothetical protein